ncbi:MAG: V-type ATPase subunit [Pseudomonadota bacterium]
MYSSGTNAYLNCRVAGMADKLLGDANLRELLSLGLDELGNRLGLESILESRMDTRARTRAVEQALISSLLADLIALIRPMPPAARGLVIAWAQRYALFNLKTLLRGRVNHIEPGEIQDNLYDLPDQVRLEEAALFRADSVDELLQLLEDTPLRSLARQAREVYTRQHDAFTLEAALDQRYYAGLVRRAVRMKDSPSRRLVGILVDRADVLWLLRFRFGYDLAPSETFYQLIPSPRLMHRQRLRSLVAMDTQEQVLENLPPPLVDLLRDCPNLIEAKRRLDQYVIDEARRIMRLGETGVGRAFAYLILRETERRHVFALIHSRLLNLPDEATEIALGIRQASCTYPRAEAA